MEANAADIDFLDLTQDLFLTQHVREPTRGNNVLDLVFSSDPDSVSDVKVCALLSETCDHNIVEFSFKSDVTKKCWKAEYYDFRRADWDSFRRYLESSENFKLVFGNIKAKWDTFVDVIDKGVQLFVPKRVRKVFGPQKPLWWNANVQRVRKNRIKWWNRYKETHLDHDFIRFKNTAKQAS